MPPWGSDVSRRDNLSAQALLTTGFGRGNLFCLGSFTRVRTAQRRNGQNHTYGGGLMFAQKMAALRLARAEWRDAKTPAAQAQAWHRVQKAERALQQPARKQEPRRVSAGSFTLGAVMLLRQAARAEGRPSASQIRAQKRAAIATRRSA